MGPAIATIASLMLFVGACRSVGLLDRITNLIIRSARGDSRRLMSLLFWIGAGFGALFTNDAAILLLTPLTIQLCLNRQGQHSDEDHLPFLLPCSILAIWRALLVISNPINIIAASYFDIPFLNYFFWMAIPALLSMLVTWMGLMVVFRRELRAKPEFIVDASFEMEGDGASGVAHQWVVGVLLFIVLTFFTLEQITGFPIWIVAVSGAAITCSYAYAVTGKAKVITSRVDAPILVFMTAVAVVAVAGSQRGTDRGGGRRLAPVTGDQYRVVDYWHVFLVCSGSGGYQQSFYGEPDDLGGRGSGARSQPRTSRGHGLAHRRRS